MLWFKQRRFQGFRNDDLCFKHMDHSNFRHFAYRNYIDFIHGHLGRQNRKVIPACVVAFIRRKWPDANGQYTGFKPCNIQDDEADEPEEEDELFVLYDELSE